MSNGGTLTLGENITVKGDDTSGSPGINYVFQLTTNNSALVMEAGSKVTKFVVSQSFLNGGTFKMYGGTIDYCQSNLALISASVVEMWDGAKALRRNNMTYLDIRRDRIIPVSVKQCVF
jgi:hypothetical protein